MRGNLKGDAYAACSQTATTGGAMRRCSCVPPGLDLTRIAIIPFMHPVIPGLRESRIAEVAGIFLGIYGGIYADIH